MTRAALGALADLALLALGLALCGWGFALMLDAVFPLPRRRP